MDPQLHATGEQAQIRPPLAKAPTGIFGLDDVTGGGLPRGRTTLVCGGPGCGKTLLAAEFLSRGAGEFGEPGVLISFEESAEELAQNVRSLDLDLDDLVSRGLVVVDHVRVDRAEIEEAGEFDLDGLFIRLELAVQEVGARRVVLDTIEALFAGISNEPILRSELRRLFRWLNDHGLTTVVTAERGEGQLTRHGLEEYVSDCVILLDHRVTRHVSTRRLRVVKYRGSSHGTNEYPFIIGDTGLSVLPVTSLGLGHDAPVERISSGVERLDGMLDGQGFFRGSTILVSGTAGTGKTSIAAAFADASCRRGDRCLFAAFEESPLQLLRNMRSIGIDLQPWVDGDLLRITASRPMLQGLEMHLVALHRQIEEFEPESVVVDPISNLLAAGEASEVEATLTRLIDYLKDRGITTLMTSLTQAGSAPATAEAGVSSLMDAWIGVSMEMVGMERVRRLQVLKARGTAHSNRVHRVEMSETGISLTEE